jgi:hypothetical protein
MICETGDPDLFPELKIPRSTIRNRFRRILAPVSDRQEFSESVRQEFPEPATPNEIHFGNGDAVVIDLAAARVRARHARIVANRMATFGVRVGGHDLGASQLQRAESRMS